ncbi:MAG: hypothetical protein U9R27_09810 [Campylobacterota bacterium]|nr:hypothetical protein [Campylobacterota bacterium]
MKRLFLHIGFHKTGTSALQEYLDENREKLIKNGIFYPKSHSSLFPGNVDLSWAFDKTPPSWSSVDKTNKNDIIKYYKDQIDETSCETIIISSEDFVLLDGQSDSIEKIRKFFIDYDTKIIAYVREPIEFILSLYSHAVRSRSINCSFKKYIAEKYSFRAADYPTRLQPWIKIFGRENLIVKKYLTAEFVNSNLVDDFFAATGIEVEVDKTMNRSNIGIHPWLIQPYIEISSANIVEKIKVKKLRELSLLGLDLPKEDTLRYLLEKEDLEIIRNSYQVSRNRLKRDFGIEF